MLRRRMMMAQGGVSLPAGYTKIEYLESDGTQFIDTGVSAKGGFRAQLTVSQLSATPEAYIIGAHGTGIPYARNGIGITSDKYMIGMCGYELLAPAQYNTPLEIECSTIIPNAYLKVNGETLGTFSSYINADATNGTELTSNNILIFSSQWHVVNIQPPQGIKAKLWKCKIYSADGTLVRDYIPCTNPIGVKGLWDKVNKKFYALTPTGYTRLAYLESNGSDYIDTGYKPNQNTRVVAEMSYVSHTNGTCGLFGGGASPSTFETYYWNTEYYFAYGSAAYNATANGSVGEKMLIDLSATKATYKIGETVIDVTPSAAQTFVSDYTMVIHALRRASSVSYTSNTRTYSFKIYDNGTLVRDFIPCTNPDGISGLWDSVNDVFYQLLPADYTRLDFIETDGTTYIDTGFKPNQDTRVVANMCLLKDNTTQAANAFFGARTSATSKVFGLQWHRTNGFQVFYGDGHTAISEALPTVATTYDFDKGTLSYNGNSVVRDYTAFQCAYSLYIFALNNAGSPTFQSYARLYSFRIYDNGTLVRDFIPAMNASGEAGLYDLKNDVWYALLPIVKPKVENKIRVEIGHNCYFREVYNPITGNYEELYMCEVLAIADYSVESNITINFKRNTGANTETVKLNRGYKNRVLFDYNPQLLSIKPSITSISPTEDDTYIYTF